MKQCHGFTAAPLFSRLYKMYGTQAFVSLLLLGLKLHEVKGNCDFIESQELCVCSLQEQMLIHNLMACLEASTYEIRGGNLEQFAGLSMIQSQPHLIEVLKILQVSKLIFTDLLVPDIILPAALEFASYPLLLSHLEFMNCSFLRSANWHYTKGVKLQVSSLRLHQVTATHLADILSYIPSLRSWLEILENLTMTESRVASIPCTTGRLFTALHFLDVSGNHFQDHTINSSFCQGAFPQLQVLKLHQNNLTSYDTVCETFGKFRMLTHLDLSQNDFPPRFSSSSTCVWPQTLHIFNLSATGLELVDGSLPPNLEILDLSTNNIFILDLALSTLKELHLSQNRLQVVPPAVMRLPGLEILCLDQNQISYLPSESLLRLEHLQSLKAGHNRYNCSCPHIQEIQDLAAHQYLLPDWPKDYICSSPPLYQDVPVKDVLLSTLQCDMAAINRSSVAILLTCLHLLLCLFPV